MGANRYGGRENLHAIDFLKRMNEVAHGRFPGILTIAKNPQPGQRLTSVYLGGLGFSLKWNMGWMNDTLKYFSSNPIYRKYEQNKLTFSLIYAFTEKFHACLSRTTKSSTEKVPFSTRCPRHVAAICKSPPATRLSACPSGKKLLFMGQEFAQRSEWSEEHSLDWHLLHYASHQGVKQLVADLNHLHAAEPPLTRWISNGLASNGLIATTPTTASFRSSAGPRSRRFSRRDSEMPLPSFAATIASAFLSGGFYKEILNTDSTKLRRFRRCNLGGVHSEPTPAQDRPHSLLLTLPRSPRSSSNCRRRNSEHQLPRPLPAPASERRQAVAAFQVCPTAPILLLLFRRQPHDAYSGDVDRFPRRCNPVKLTLVRRVAWTIEPSPYRSRR